MKYCKKCHAAAVYLPIQLLSSFFETVSSLALSKRSSRVELIDEETSPVFPSSAIVK